MKFSQVLLAIFRHLPFHSIRPLSMVCHRWNRLIFDSCSSQLVFSPRQWDQLCTDRSYRHLDLSFCEIPVPSKKAFDDTKYQLEMLASRASSVRISGTKPWFTEQLVRILRNFRQLQELRWEVSGKMRDVWMTEDRFRLELEGTLPKIKVLSLVINNSRMVNLLEKLSENLESLEVRFKIGPMLTALASADLKLSKLRTYNLKVFLFSLKNTRQTVSLLERRIQDSIDMTVTLHF